MCLDISQFLLHNWESSERTNERPTNQPTKPSHGKQCTALTWSSMILARLRAYLCVCVFPYHTMAFNVLKKRYKKIMHFYAESKCMHIQRQRNHFNHISAHNSNGTTQINLRKNGFQMFITIHANCVSEIYPHNIFNTLYLLELPSTNENSSRHTHTSDFEPFSKCECKRKWNN